MMNSFLKDNNNNIITILIYENSQHNVMTTNNHLKNFIELEPEIRDELSKTADELLEAGHLDRDNTMHLAKVLFRLGRHDESIEQLEKILSFIGDDENALALIALNHFRKDNHEAAIEYLNRRLEMDPDNETLLSYKMLSCKFLNRYENAIRCGERIVKINPKNTQAISHLIDCHFKLENYDKCLKYLSQAKIKDHYRKALILYKLGRYEECIEEAGKAKSAESYHIAGESYLKLGNSTKAVKYLYRSYEMDMNADTLFEISEIYLEAWDHQRAIHYLKEVLAHDDRNAEAYSRIAQACLDSSNWHDAIAYSKKALEISRNVPDAYATLANAYFKLEHDFEKAIQVIDEGISENPESFELWMQRGGFSYPYDMTAFKESYEKAINLNPRGISIYQEYIYLLLTREEYEDAKRYYNRMLLYNPLFEESFEDLSYSMLF